MDNNANIVIIGRDQKSRIKGHRVRQCDTNGKLICRIHRIHEKRQQMLTGDTSKQYCSSQSDTI